MYDLARYVYFNFNEYVSKLKTGTDTLKTLRIEDLLKKGEAPYFWKLSSEDTMELDWQKEAILDMINFLKTQNEELTKEIRKGTQNFENLQRETNKTIQKLKDEIKSLQYIETDHKDLTIQLIEKTESVKRIQKETNATIQNLKDEITKLRLELEEIEAVRALKVELPDSWIIKD